MRYTERSLTAGEKIIYRTGLHWIVLLLPSILGSFVVLIGTLFLIGGSASGGLLVMAFGALIIALAVMVRNATEMAVTSKRVIVKTGILRKNTIELFLSKVESIRVDQGVSGRMFGYGNIVVRGTGGTAEPFRHIRSPLELRRHAQQQSEDLVRI